MKSTLLSLFLIGVKLLTSRCSADLLDTVIFIGDSDVYYWGTRGGSNDVVAGSTNLGVPGYTCLSLINAIDGYLQDHNPTLVVLKCGTNDMAGGVSAQNAADRFQSIVDTILAYSSDVKVLGVGTKPEPNVVAMGPADAWQEYNDLIKTYGEGLARDALPNDSRFSFIDAYDGLLALGNPSSFYMSDNIHLSLEGYGHLNTWATTAIEFMEFDSNASGSDIYNCVVWISNECTSCVTDSGSNNTQTCRLTSSAPVPSPTGVNSPAPSVKSSSPKTLRLSSTVMLCASLFVLKNALF